MHVVSRGPAEARGADIRFPGAQRGFWFPAKAKLQSAAPEVCSAPTDSARSCLQTRREQVEEETACVLTGVNRHNMLFHGFL